MFRCRCRTPEPTRSSLDKLLASPRYGEHWGRHWLDVAELRRHARQRPRLCPDRMLGPIAITSFVRSTTTSPIRDSCRSRSPATLCFPAIRKRRSRSAFWRPVRGDDTLMATVREDTVDHRLSQYLDRDNMVSTVMSSFQSLTVHCARCHNHKFDPISQREYYGLQAVFAGVDRADRPFDDDRKTHVVPARFVRPATSRCAHFRGDGGAGLAEAGRKVAAAIADIDRRARAWAPLDVINVTSVSSPEGTLFARQDDGSWLVRGVRPDKDTFIVTARTTLQSVRALRLEVLPDDSLPHRGPGRFDNGNFHLSEFRATAQPATGPTQGAMKLTFRRALADHSDAGDVVANTLDGRDDTYWSIHPRYGEPHEAVFELKEPAGFAVGTTLTLMLEFKGKTGHQIGRFRLSACTDAMPAEFLTPVPAPLAEQLRRTGERTAAQTAENWR